MIEYAAREPGGDPPKLYVPVSEAHLVGKYVGAGKVRPPLNTLGGARWKKAKEHAERAVRDVAAELLQIQAAREARPGTPFSRTPRGNASLKAPSSSKKRRTRSGPSPRPRPTWNGPSRWTG